MATDLRITLLGPLSVSQGDRLLSEQDWHSRHEPRLLGILITAGGARVSSDRLIDWLWPDAEQRSAAITLRSAISNLRHILEPERLPRMPSHYILTRPGGYAWNTESGAIVDVDQFTSHLQYALAHPPHAPEHAAHLQQAIRLYRGDYLEDELDAPWAIARRATLRERFLAAVQELAELALLKGNSPMAIDLVLQGLSHDRLREPLYRTLMQAQTEAGDVAGALQSYERYRQFLDAELGAVPSLLTQQLHTAILRGERPWSSVPGHPQQTRRHHTARPAAPFVGRSHELAAFRSWMDDLAQQHGGVVALVGEGGIGKTRLIHETLHMAVAHGIQTILLRCSELERGVPFAPLSEALRPLVRSIPDITLQELPMTALAQAADLLPSLRERVPHLPELPFAPPNEHHNHLLDGLADLALALAHTTPLVICCDDAHWADDATLTILGRLARRAHRHALLIVLSYRSEDLPENNALHALLRNLGREMLLRPIVLGRLTSDDVLLFLTKQADAPAKQIAELGTELTTISGGNPLFLTVVLQSLLESHGVSSLAALLPQLEHMPTLPDLAGSPPIRDLVLARIERLPAPARSLLEQLAIIGRPASLDLIEQLAGPAALDSAQILLERQLLIEGPGERLGFAHELVRTMVASMLSSPRRRQLHQQAAEAILKRSGEHPEHSAELAFHFGQIGRGAEGELLRYALAAADHARSTFGYNEAIRHYDTAIQAAERQSDRAPLEMVRQAFQGRLLACEALLDWDGIMTTAARYEQWNRSAAPIMEPHRLATLRALMGDLAGAAHMSAELAQRQPELLPTIQDMLWRTAQILGPPGQVAESPPRNLQELPRFTPAPPLPGTPATDLPELLGISEAVLPLFKIGWATLSQGLLSDAEPCLLQSYRLAGQTGQPAIAVIAALQLSHLNALRGNRDEADRWLTHSLDLAQRAPEVTWASIWPRIHQAFLLLLDERQSEAREHFAILEQQLERMPAFHSHRASVRAGLGLVAITQGDLTQAAARLAAAQTPSHLLYGFVYIAVRHGMARLAVLRGDQANAYLILADALHYCVQHSLLPEYIHTLLEIAALDQSAGQRLMLLPLLRHAQEIAEATGLAPLAASVQTVLRQ